MNAAVSIHVLKISPNELPPELLPTDRILLRWAASVGDGSKEDPAWQEIIRARFTQLPDSVAIVVDQLVLRSPYRTLTELWYRTPQPREVIAQRMRLNEDKVYPCWRAALKHYRAFFETSPLCDLRKLATLDIRSRLDFVRGAMDRALEPVH